MENEEPQTVKLRNWCVFDCRAMLIVHQFLQLPNIRLRRNPSLLRCNDSTPSYNSNYHEQARATALPLQSR
jgi:hypothetical protein